MDKCRPTILACFLSYIVQSVIVNFAPLLFVTFSEEFDVSLELLTLLATLNFGVQLTVDLLASRFIHKIGYRKGMLLAHTMAFLGLVSMMVLPDLLGGFAGLLISVMIYAVGGGLLEVLVSPIVEACPTKNKAGIMSLMHSFYCWGVVATVLVSTGFFVLFGTHNWRIMAIIWAILPLCNFLMFLKVPLYPIVSEGEDKPNYKELFSQKIFVLMLVLMVCSGACEQAVAQWASAFTEKALSLDKTTGDLLGVCGFSVMMGLARMGYAKFSEKLPMKPAMIFSAALCIVSYLIVSLSSSPVVGLIGCIVCGFSVGLFWPGTFSLGTVSVKGCSTTMFALMALGGDIGCSLGPSVVGAVSGMFGGEFKIGILAAIVFPVVLLIGLILLTRIKEKKTL